MSLIVILLPALALYIATLYWLYKRLDIKATWQGSNIELIHDIDKPMFNFTKRLLDLFTVLLLFIFIIIPPVTVILGLSQNSSPNWGIDINIFSGFSLNLTELQSIKVTGLRNPEISGKTLIAIDTSNTFAFYLFMSLQYAMAIAGLYAVSQIRLLMISLKKGNSFSIENASRIKRVGYLVVAWNMLSPIFQYFAWGSIVNSIHFNNSGINLYPAFEFDILAVFIGIMMIILANLFVEASIISQEQRLTI